MRRRWRTIGALHARHAPSGNVGWRTAQKAGCPDQQGGASAAESGARRGRGRPRNPPAVERDMPEEAIVREKLTKMTIGQLQKLCAEMSVDAG